MATSPTEFNAGINKPILTVLNRALEKEVVKRYAHAKEMGKHIHMILEKMHEIEAKKGARR